LDEFYRTTQVYDAFKSLNQLPDIWRPIKAEIERISRRKEAGREPGACRVLEFGAGRTGFGDFLGDLRGKVEYHTQDVTPSNKDVLESQSNRAIIGDVLDLAGPYDVIFSTFVWEHITNPRAVLDHLLKILSPDGSLFLASPRYDLAGYVPPTARHYGFGTRAALAARLQLARLATRLGGRPRFLIHLDPALFHKPWYRDADAIHWVSLHDLRRALPPTCRLSIPDAPAPGGLKRQIWKRFCLLFVRIHKGAEAGA
jgi:SAM-dependent methyltransferase